MIVEATRERLLETGFNPGERSDMLVRGAFTVWFGSIGMSVWKGKWGEDSFDIIGGVLFADPDFFVKVEELVV